MDVKPGDCRYHQDIGACEIFSLGGRLGFLVAVSKDVHGRAIGVCAVDALDDRGWGKPRKKRGWTSEEIDRVVRLRKAGMTQREIARETGMSRAAVGKKIVGIKAGSDIKPQPTIYLMEEDKKEIVLLVKKGWRKSVVANWIGCDEQAILDLVRRDYQRERRLKQVREQKRRSQLKLKKKLEGML